MCCLVKNGPEITMTNSCLENPKCEGVGFNALKTAQKNLHENTIKILRELLTTDYDAVVIEMPCYTQSSLSALLIGMCWGAIGDIDAVFVEPSALKKWSNSKKGDGKSKVKEKVLERALLSPKEAANDNIVDAVGLALMMIDLVAKLKYDHYNSNP